MLWSPLATLYHSVHSPVPTLHSLSTNLLSLSKNDSLSASESDTTTNPIHTSINITLLNNRPLLLLLPALPLLLLLPLLPLGLEPRTRHLLRRGGPSRRCRRCVRVRRSCAKRVRDGDGGVKQLNVRAGPDLWRVLRGEVRGGPAVVHSWNVDYCDGNEFLCAELRVRGGRGR